MLISQFCSHQDRFPAALKKDIWLLYLILETNKRDFQAHRCRAQLRFNGSSHCSPNQDELSDDFHFSHFFQQGQRNGFPQTQQPMCLQKPFPRTVS